MHKCGHKLITNKIINVVHVKKYAHLECYEDYLISKNQLKIKT